MGPPLNPALTRLVDNRPSDVSPAPHTTAGTTGGGSREINASTKRQLYTFMNDCVHVLQTPFTSVCADNSASIDRTRQRDQTMSRSAPISARSPYGVLVTSVTNRDCARVQKCQQPCHLFIYFSCISSFILSYFSFFSFSFSR